MKFRATILAALTGLFFYASLALVPGVGWCRTASMDGPMTNANAALGQAYPARFNLNTDDKDVDYVSAQVVYSSAIIAAVTFNDGTAATGTFTVVTPTALSTAAATGKLTVVDYTLAAGHVSTASVSIISNTTGTVINITGPPGGLRFQLGGNWPALGGPSGLAISLTALINASSNTTGVIASTNTGATLVGLATISSGTAYNSFAVTSTTPTAISTAAFLGGREPVTITIGGVGLKAGRDFTIGASSNTMAFAISQIVDASSATTLVTSTASTVCTSAASCGIIYASATITGTVGNTFGLGSTNQLAVSTSAPTLKGGTDNAQLCINGTCLTANTNWYPRATAALTADSLYAAINTSFTIVKATQTAGVIYTTATITGPGGRYALASSSNPALSLGVLVSSSATTGASTGVMAGGAITSSYTLNSQRITIASHGLPTGLKVSISTTVGNYQLQYTSAAVGTATNLVFGSTWYVIPIDANTIGLSITSTGAVAGLATDGIYLVSSRTVMTTDVWQVNVATTAGSTSYGWFESNDGVNFWQVPGTSSTTITTGDSFVYPSTFTFVDFGNVTAKWLQFNVSPPATAGAIKVKAYIHGEKR